jgi:hypothetical protein
VLNSRHSCPLFQVTYRSLSHALGIHVNQAKKWALRLLYRTRDDLSAANLRSITPSTQVLSTLLMRLISLEASHASRTWIACAMQTK